jgi:[protein-PII] uridylyltransferase
VFDVQTALAHEMGLTDTPNRRASEQLMQRYYRAAKSIRQINVILLQNLHARLFPAEVKIRSIDADFQAVDELLDLKDDALFIKRPSAIFDSFLTLQLHPELKGMSAPLLRALWRNRDRVDAAFRRDPVNRARFLDILRQPRGVTHELRRMNQYGILGRYLPVFGRIVGQISNIPIHGRRAPPMVPPLRRFMEPQHAHEYPLCSRLIAACAAGGSDCHRAVPHRQGRGATTPARRAMRGVCRGTHRGGHRAGRWLVGSTCHVDDCAKTGHQRQGLSTRLRPGQDGRRLAALYLLTVADIRGTSPKFGMPEEGGLSWDPFHAAQARIVGGPATAGCATASMRGVRRRYDCFGSMLFPTAQRTRCGSDSTPCTSSGTPRMKSPGTRATFTSA